LKATGSSRLGSRRVKIRYGPYEVPGKNRGAIGKMMDGEGGMAWNMPDKNVQKPCTDCMITYMGAGLENMQGEVVNTDKGLWLHHMVIINKGKSLKDATCASNPISLPHIDVGASARNSERFFASGNERTATDMTAEWAKAGYYVSKEDQFSYIIELMNMNKDSKKVYMTMTWEYVPGVPSGFKNARPVWLDAFQCGLSDVEPKKQEGAFDITARTWTANFGGELLGMGAHLHDGGDYLDIVQNGKVKCRAAAKYENGDMDMGGGGGMGGGDGMKSMDSGKKSSKKSSKKSIFGLNRSTQLRDSKKHISEITFCGTSPEKPLGRMSKGDRWDIKGHYDYNKWDGMLRTNGKQSDVMAIAVMMVAIPMDSSRR
jgi:hypothetical protein